jgi:peptidoglycan hydrolase-like protein with peptidoglycan-binding domain
MTRSPLTTDNYNSPQKNNPNRWREPDHVVLHHWAGTNWNNVVSMMVHRTRVVSSNVIIQDRRIGSMMEEEDRSWSLASAHWDGRSLTAECANSTVGGSWPLSPETHESIARWVSDVCTRYGIPINRERVLGHREVYTRHGASYATACPGGMDLEWVVARARVIQSETAQPEQPVPAPKPTPPAVIVPDVPTFNGYPIHEIQRRLGVHGFRTAVDGIYGPDTRRQVTNFQKARRLLVDGVVGPQTWAALLMAPPAARPPAQPYDTVYRGYSVRRIQELLTAAGFRTVVDGIYGPNTTSQVRAFQRAQGIQVDGIVGPVTWGRLNAPRRPTPPKPVARPVLRRGDRGAHVVHLQSRLRANGYSLDADGVFGPITEARVRAFQRAQRIAVDGIVGPQTWGRLG